MIKKFNHFIKENVDVMNITDTKVSKSDYGSDRYMMMFMVKNDKIYDNIVVLLNEESLEDIETKKAISTMYLLAGFVDDSRVYKVEMTEEHVIEARNQTGLELEISKSYVLDPKQELYNWLLGNMDTLPPPQRAQIVK